MEYKKRLEIQRLYCQEGLDSKDIAERLGIPESTVRYQIKHPPKHRQPMPEPPSRQVYSSPPPQTYLPPAPVQAEPPNYIDAVWWEETKPQPARRALLPAQPGAQKHSYRHPETGLFITKEEYEQITRDSRALARREPQQAIARREEFNPYDAKPFIEGIASLTKWIGRKLFGESRPAPASNQQSLPAENQNPFINQNFIPTHQPNYKWDEPVNGLNARQTYGYVPVSYESGYYICDHCGHSHQTGYGCPWNGYR